MENFIRDRFPCFSGGPGAALAAAAILLATVPHGDCKAADQAAAPAATNVSADMATWDLERCRAELAKLEDAVREIPAQMKTAREAVAAARKAAQADPQHQALAGEIATLTRQLEQKRQELAKIVDSAPAVKQAREQEEVLNARLKSIHKSIAAAREQLRKLLVKKEADKAGKAPAQKP